MVEVLVPLEEVFDYGRGGGVRLPAASFECPERVAGRVRLAALPLPFLIPFAVARQELLGVGDLPLQHFGIDGEAARTGGHHCQDR